MNLSQLTQFVSNLSQQFQQTLSLAKRIEELPVQESVLPTSKIHVSNGGVSQSLEIQKIIDAASGLDYNRITSIGTIQRSGNDFTVPANATWKISGVEGTNISPFEFELLPETSGDKRIDLLIVRLSGFEVITGTPSSSISFAPDIPNPSNAILVKEFKIDGNSINEGTAPISGNPYIYKNQFNQVSAAADKKFYLQLQSNYLIIDPEITEITGIYLTENGEAESYTGKIGFFTNFLEVEIPMRHMHADAPVKFKFPKTAGDYLIQPGETLYFIEESYGVADSNLWKCLNENIASVNAVDLISDDANNAAVLGSDEKIFVPQVDLSTKQNTLVSGQNIKTFNGQSILGAGNISIPTFPPPYLEELIPDSYRPNNTGDFILKGSYFTEGMTGSFQGQTLNGNITVINSNTAKANLTTGSVEGFFNVTLNNGTSRTFQSALFIVDGVVFTPTYEQWANLHLADVSEEGRVLLQTFGSKANALWTKELDYTKNWSLRFSAVASPLGVYPQGQYDPTDLHLINASNQKIFSFRVYRHPSGYVGISKTQVTGSSIIGVGSNFLPVLEDIKYELRFVNNVFFAYVNGTLTNTFTQTITSNLKLLVTNEFYDFQNIKYVEFID